MKLSEFNYDLPKELIAQKPVKTRDSARLLVIDRGKGIIEDKTFKDIIGYLQEGDCLVLNNTRVLPVRIYGRRKTGGKVELFILDTAADSEGFFRTLVRPSRRIKQGEEIEIEGSTIKADVSGYADIGRFVKFSGPIEEVLKIGHVPLPPYIARDDEPEDERYYQTVYACRPGATASPTAGLHFTEGLLEEINRAGVKIAYITLHTSYGTFSPVTEENIEDHIMHAEYYEIPEEEAAKINSTINSGGRVFAVGTTSVRTVETAASGSKKVVPSSGETKLFIYPGYKFKMIDSIITNFHLPESTLLMLVSAFAGRDLVMEAYKKAVEEKYRFFSYGDAMLII